MSDDIPEFEESGIKIRVKGADLSKMTVGQQLLRGALALAIVGIFFGGLYFGLREWAKANEPPPAPPFPLAKNSASKLLVPLTIDFLKFRRVEPRDADEAVGAWTGYTLGSTADWTGKSLRAYRSERAGSGKSLAFGISSQTEPQNGEPCAIIYLKADAKTDAGEYKIWLTQTDSDGNKTPLPMITVVVK